MFVFEKINIIVFYWKWSILFYKISIKCRVKSTVEDVFSPLISTKCEIYKKYIFEKGEKVMTLGNGKKSTITEWKKPQWMNKWMNLSQMNWIFSFNWSPEKESDFRLKLYTKPKKSLNKIQHWSRKVSDFGRIFVLQ